MNIYRRSVSFALAVIILASANTPSVIANTVRTKVAPGPVFSADRVRFQYQAAFGYNSTLDNTLRNSDFETWIEDQFDLSPTPSTSGTNPFPTFDLQPSLPRPTCNGIGNVDADEPIDSPANCFRDSYSMHPMQRWLIKEAVSGDAQLRLRVAWALSQIWVISGNEITQSRHMSEYFKKLYLHALGTPNVAGEDYYNLMKDMTLNPGMGEYLDMSVSTKNHRNENYARELLQLFTTGVDEYNPNGTIKLVNGARVPVYSQAIVEDYARVFTGWSFCNLDCTNSRPGTINFVDPMKLNADEHNLESKTLLTSSYIAPCIGCNRLSQRETYANNSMETALRSIFNHPNVPFFVSRQLIQHLVMSDPSPAYVTRVAAVFANNGNNVRGDMKAVVRAILLDADARGDSKEGTGFEQYGKLREPVQYAANVLRVFSATTDGVIFEDPAFKKMGQNPFYSPSVFNYYSPHNRILGGSVNAPEFGLMTATTSVSRYNFANRMAFEGIPQSSPGSYTTALNLTEMTTLAANTNDIVLALNQRLMHGTMSVNTQNQITTRLNAMITNGNTAAERAKEAVYMAITSHQFQVQR